MSKYYLEGYTPPADVTSSEKVKEYQRQLGVTVDGIWGPKTQAAYDKVYGNSNTNNNTNTGTTTDTNTNTSTNTSSSSNSSSTNITSDPKTFWEYYNSILSTMTVPTLDVDVPTKSEVAADISEFLRPSYDTAIDERKQAGRSNMAEIDADAAARGMGSSTFVTSMKAREQDDVSDDIAKYETDYASTLAKSVYDAMLSYRELELQAEKFNAEAKQNVQNTALSIAETLYQAFLDQQAALLNASSESSSSSSSSSKSSSSSSSSKKTESSEKSSSTYELPDLISYENCLMYLSSLKREQLRLLATSSNEYWKVRRDRLLDSLGEDQYLRLLGPNGEFNYKRR